MRALDPALVRTLGGLALALILVPGCAKKATAPNSRTLPEGLQDGQLLMMGWREQPSYSFTIADPGTPENPFDDRLSAYAEDFHMGPGVVRSATFDGSPANAMEPFRIGSDGNAQAVFDFLLAPSLRFIGLNTDLYQFDDPNPTGATPSYVGRGLVDGLATVTSPVSNVIRVSGTIDETLDFLVTPKLFAGDSVLKIRYTEDPRATFYVVEVNDAGAVLGNGSSYAFERRARAIPSPLQPGTRPLSSLFAVLPPGVGSTGISTAISSPVWPIPFYIRVSAYDADGRMVNRVNDFLRSRNRDADTNLTSFEPLGGAVEVLDPYPNPVAPSPVPDVLTSGQAAAILAGFPRVAPTVTSFARGGPLAAERPATSLDRVRALSLVARSPRFTPEGLRRGIAAARASMDRGARGAAPTAGRRADTVPSGR
jgi:hypothetical protein